MSASQLETLKDEIVAALAANNLDTARSKLDQAHVILALTPNMTGGLSSIQWRESIDNLQKLLQQRAARARAPIFRVPIRHKRPENLEDCA